MVRRLGRHPWLAPVLIAALSLVLSASLSLLAPLPVPKFHDEFSYLLAGETFARGRLTNPQHPLWRFFETFQVLSQPTYMSKYPPAQGMILALGRAVFHEPIVGVWISTALACAAAWWALAGLLPRRWAALGALILAFHPLMLRWNWSYWGGAGAMIGGCLLVGAVARLGKSSNNIISGAMLGLGIGILLNSRPFEGAVLTLVCIFAAPYRSHGRKSVVPSLIAGTTLILAALLWTGFYNHRITGSAMQFPYTLYEKQYAVTAPLVFLPPPSTQPTYHHDAMHDFYLNWELPRYQQQRTLAGLTSVLGEKTWSLMKAYFASPALIAPMLVSIWMLRRDRMLRRMGLIGLITLAAALGGLQSFPHYTAPAAIMLLYFVVQGLRYLRVLLPRRNFAVPIILWLHVISGGVMGWRLVSPTEGWEYTRARMQTELSHEGQHLVIVRSTDTVSHFDWVYNEPDIDSAAVVWARDMGSEANRELLDYFRDRQVWLLSVDAASAKLDPYRR